MVPEIVVSEPFGSVETEGGIVVTDGDCELLDSVSVVPEMVVSEPFGSVDTDGGMVVTEKLSVGVEIKLEGRNVNVSPSVVRMVGVVT